MRAFLVTFVRGSRSAPQLIWNPPRYGLLSGCQEPYTITDERVVHYEHQINGLPECTTHAKPLLPFGLFTAEKTATSCSSRLKLPARYLQDLRQPVPSGAMLHDQAATSRSGRLPWRYECPYSGVMLLQQSVGTDTRKQRVGSHLPDIDPIIRTGLSPASRTAAHSPGGE